MRGREYQRDIIRDESPHIVIPKGAQLGLTTVFLIRTFHWMTKRKWKHLYLLPLKTGAVPFVQGRMDSLIDSNKELASQFSSVDNRLHKQTREKVNLYIRGTNVWTELREIPVDVIVFDERDKMVEDNIPEAMARLDGSKIQRIVELSTPTLPGHGVDSEDSWGASDQHRWYVPCPHCSRRQTFTFEESVVVGDTARECYLRCMYCNKQITDDEKAAANEFGYWEPDDPSADVRGYHINQLNSPTKPIHGFVDNYFKGQSDSKLLRAFFNNNLGLPYTAPGNQITPELLDKCIGRGFTLGGIPAGGVFVGVDVGTVLHMSASYFWNGKRHKWAMQTFADKPGYGMWGQLDDFLNGLSSFVCVIDAHPEKTQARDLSVKYPGAVWIGFEKDRPDQAAIADWRPFEYGEEAEVVIDRTMAFDTVMTSYMKGNTVLPIDAREIGENMPTKPYNGFYYQMCQQAADEEEDAKGRTVRRWVKNKNPDHWHHCDMFELIASLREPSVIINPTVGEMFARSGGVIAA